MWSPMIRQMLYDGSTNEEIIVYFNHPVVNEDYIKEVQRSYKKLTTKQYNGYVAKPRKNVPAEGTKLRIVYDYVVSNYGSLPEFLKQYDGKRRELAKKIGVSLFIMNNFLRDFKAGRTRSPKWLGHHWSLESKLNIEQYYKTGKLVKKARRITLKEVKDLW